MENAVEREFGWDDEIQNDSGEYTLLPEGDYNFTVTGFERARHSGSAKLPPCNKAVLDIKIESPQGDVMIRHNLFLHTKTEGMLCAFFTAIGQRRKGERVKMNWNAVPGARGRCKVGIHEYTGDDGVTRKYNNIKKFYEPDTAAAPAAAFTPGNF